MQGSLFQGKGGHVMHFGTFQGKGGTAKALSRHGESTFQGKEGMANAG